MTSLPKNAFKRASALLPSPSSPCDVLVARLGRLRFVASHLHLLKAFLSSVERASALLLFCLFTLSIPTYAKLISDYSEKTGKLNSLEIRVKDSKEKIKNTLKAIKISEDENEQKDFYQQALTEHAEMKKSIKEYNSIREELKYKYPKKNDQTERRYLPMREETIEDIVNESGISGILSRIKKKIDAKYKKFTLADKEEPSPGKNKKHNKSNEPEKEKLVLER